MKKIISLLTIASVAMGTVSCTDDFLDRMPKADPSEGNAFVSYETCTYYLQSLYTMFQNGSTYFQGPSMVNGFAGTSTRDTYSGLVVNYGTGYGNLYGNANAQVVPASNSTYTAAYTFVRRANLLLSHIGDPACTDAERNYIEATARFFRAYAHYAMMINWGDIVYLDHLIDETAPELKREQNSRLYVADQIYKELVWCIEHMPDITERNTIKPDVVKAFMSRFSLFEGTWRKYHNVDESQCASNNWVTGEQLLEACVKYSKEVMDAHPNLHMGNKALNKIPGCGWGELATLEDLAGVDEVLLYVHYVENIKTHRIDHYEHIANAQLDLPQNTVNLYLTRDGLPIGNANVKYYKYVGPGSSVDDLYEEATADEDKYDYANADIYKTFRRRDPRLWQTAMPPFSLKSISGNEYTTFGPDSPWSEYLNQFPSRGAVVNADNNSYRIRSVNSTYDRSQPHKTLPSANWEGVATDNVPNTQSVTNSTQIAAAREAGTPVRAGKDFQRSKSGYFVWRHHQHWGAQHNNTAFDISDKPLFKVSEVMLNYAEAMFELGRFDQTVADATINKLRDRADVGHMTVSAIDDSFDPNRPKVNDDNVTIDPKLWEIRRERLVELMCESFSWEDVRRWKMAKHFVDQQYCGVFVENATQVMRPLIDGLATGILNPETGLEYQSAGELEAAGNKGHLFTYRKPADGAGWQEHYYLNPVPLDEIALNPQLHQTPGWE